MASEFQDHGSDDLELDSDEIEVGDDDSWVYEETSSFIESPLPEGQTQATFGGVAGVSVLRTNREPAPSLPAVELPYDPGRHVEIGPPTTNEDAIFVPAIDADPADYTNPSGRVDGSGDGDEE